MTVYRIARGVAGHAPALRAIERQAGDRFRTIGMANVAAGEPTAASILDERASAGRLYVAIHGADALAGFLIWSPKDGLAYIEEVSIHPAHAGHRLARLMIDRLAADVKGVHSALTLATFRDVPWNAPYYRKLGFEEWPLAAAGSGHLESWRAQADAGLDMATRLFMIRKL